MKSVSKFRLKNVSLLEEYKKRHDEVWPEMLELMKQSGINNYSIWNTGDELIEYFETEDIEKVYSILGSSEVKARWDHYMSDIIEKEGSHGEAVPLTCMFTFNGIKPQGVGVHSS